MNKKIKLVLSGSGLLYPCHAGAVIRLAEEGYEFQELCGVSGGSVIAAALASGVKPNQELVKLIKDTLPAKNNAVDLSIFSLFSNWGLIKGDKIEKMLEQCLAKTMADTETPLHIVTTDVSRQQQRIFSSKTDPSMGVAKAVRASMSIPFVFAPVDWGGEKYVDGGWVSNFPLDLFGDTDDVVGIRFKSTSKQFSRILSIKDYIVSLIDTAISANMQKDEDGAPHAKEVVIETAHGHLDFNIDEKAVDEMIQDGRASVDALIKSGKL